MRPIKSISPMITERITVCIVHYNTPKLTECAIRSLRKHTQGELEVIVFDNSDKRPFRPMEGVEVLDNTKGQLIDFDRWLARFTDKEPSPGNNYGSAKHCYTVQWLIDHRKRPFILMDSDVLIMQDITPFWDRAYGWIGEVGENVKRRFGYDIKKLHPFLCFINVPMVRNAGILYCNPSYMWNLTRVAPNHRYDTGAWFLQEARRVGLPSKELRLKDYLLHLRHGSWRDKEPMKWLEEHKDLWN